MKVLAAGAGAAVLLAQACSALRLGRGASVVRQLREGERNDEETSRRGLLLYSSSNKWLTRRDSSKLLGAAASAVVVVASPAPARADDGKVFRPAAGSLGGKTVLVTGANAGLGLETARRLAAAGAAVVVTARTPEKVEAALRVVRATAAGAPEPEGVVLDLASLDSIRTVRDRLPARVREGGLDVLVNNAGVMAIPDRLTTADGFERQIGVNFLGHFALVAALLPTLREKASFRVVNVSSQAQMGIQPRAFREALDQDLDPAKYSQWGNYCLSKAFNTAFSLELQRRFDGAGLDASAVSLHPGVVQTELARYIIGADPDRPSTTTAESVGAMNPVQRLGLRALQLFVLPVDEGANTQVYLAAGADTATGDLAQHGTLYYDAMKVAKPNPVAVDPTLAADLFKIAECLTGVKFDI